MKNAIKHWLFNLKKKIEYFFYPERNRLSKQSRLNRKVANIIKEYFECDQDGKKPYNISSLQITKVSVKERKNIVKITVELGRPGLLIGKAGKDIDAINTILEHSFNKKISINIRESFLF